MNVSHTNIDQSGESTWWPQMWESKHSIVRNNDTTCRFKFTHWRPPRSFHPTAVVLSGTLPPDTANIRLCLHTIYGRTSPEIDHLDTDSKKSTPPHLQCYMSRTSRQPPTNVRNCDLLLWTNKTQLRDIPYDLIVSEREQRWKRSPETSCMILCETVTLYTCKLRTFVQGGSVPRGYNKPKWLAELMPFASHS